ncbi:MAG: hypothetical protein RIF34_05975, partial [Candidatus Kapaibacterium sp.]
VGRFGEEVVEMFENASFKECIETVGYVTHKESISYLIKSEALLLIVDEAKESKEIVPGKVYEYLGTKRPLFAIAPNESAIAELIYETDAGLVAHQSEIDKIAENLYEFYYHWEKSLPITQPKIKAIEQYERRNASKKLAEILDGVV